MFATGEAAPLLPSSVAPRDTRWRALKRWHRLNHSLVGWFLLVASLVLLAFSAWSLLLRTGEKGIHPSDVQLDAPPAFVPRSGGGPVNAALVHSEPTPTAPAVVQPVALPGAGPAHIAGVQSYGDVGKPPPNGMGEVHGIVNPFEDTFKHVYEDKPPSPPPTVWKDRFESLYKQHEHDLQMSQTTAASPA
eukprot:gb/GEZN01013857.1/.p1 GENE.gb/GEZN01013857.1/~~gb/GEZN01013857.1/.p1  ORF type:complete len:190 (-),score=15.42 gb/GEZN01013857.1/:357-926(-)